MYKKDYGRFTMTYYASDIHLMQKYYKFPYYCVTHSLRACHKSKINHHQNWLLGIYLWTLLIIKIKKLKKFIEPLLRSGNPDLSFLGTLKINIQIYRFLSLLSKNLGSDFIFRVAIYLWIAKSAHIWDPWKSKFLKIIKNMLKILYTNLFLL